MLVPPGEVVDEGVADVQVADEACDFWIGEPVSNQLPRTRSTQLDGVQITRPFWMMAAELTVNQLRSLYQSRAVEAFNCPTCPYTNITFFSALVLANDLSALEALTPCYVVDLEACQGTRDPTCVLATYDPECTGYRLPTGAEWGHAAKLAGLPSLCDGSQCDHIATNFTLGEEYGGWGAAGPPPAGWGCPDGLGLFNMLGGAAEPVWPSTANGDSAPVSLEDPALAEFRLLDSNSNTQYRRTRVARESPCVGSSIESIAARGAVIQQGVRLVRTAFEETPPSPAWHQLEP